MDPKRCRTQRCFSSCRKEVRMVKVGKEEGRGRTKKKEREENGMVDENAHV